MNSAFLCIEAGLPLPHRRRNKKGSEKENSAVTIPGFIYFVLFLLYPSSCCKHYIYPFTSHKDPNFSVTSSLIAEENW
jgi:hypothetical protein